MVTLKSFDLKLSHCRQEKNHFSFRSSWGAQMGTQPSELTDRKFISLILFNIKAYLEWSNESEGKGKRSEELILTAI
jgi:hypothetical protein